ncbi:hypothetical protein QFZ52_000795 [Arthrobacter woluwensis]|uniref:hypothetical protein n=1 Tax=Arthrobacter woluwensis TaxID=156980 RepID=UPI002782BBE4|nr:hypothetical protein [Arthrobacter woluwensis]MDQ0708143.1 hypothetical protein [Arthrobacter woluwensis]
MKRTSLAAALALLTLLVTSCTPDGGRPAPPAPSPTQRVVPAGNPDRDQAAVRRQLAAVDPCALLEPRTTAVLGRKPELVSTTPFDCRVQDEGVQAVSYADSTASQRHWQERLDLGGVVAYRSTKATGRCTISLPVDFDHAITLAQDAVGAYDCTQPEAYAKAVAPRLRDDPASFARKDPRPGVSVCDVLSSALGPLPTGQALAPRKSFTSSLAECGVWRDAAASGGAPVYTRQALTLAYRQPLAKLRTGGGWQDSEVRPIAGTDVLFWKDSGAGCTLLWDAWPNQTPVRDRVIQAQAEAATCADASALAQKLIPVLAKAAPQTLAKTPLVYSATEPDLAAPGACSHVVDQDLRKCAPATGAAASSDPRQTVAYGAADADTLCTAAAPTVRRIAGSALEAVTAVPPGDGVLNPGVLPVLCEFVEPSHSVVVRIGAVADLPLNSRLLLTQTRTARDTDFAGHAAKTSSGEVLRGAPDTRRTALIADTTAEAPGLLLVEMSALPDRGQGTGKVSPAARERLNGFDDLATALSKELLGAR